MSTSKVSPTTTFTSRLEIPTTNAHSHPIQQRISSSKRTTTHAFEPSVENNTTTVLQQSRTHHITRSMTQKDKGECTNAPSSKPESGSEEVYTAPSHNERSKISCSAARKQRVRQDMGDYIGQDADEESTAICNATNQAKTYTEHTHRLSTPVNNSAVHLQQQGTGDHSHHTSSKEHRSRSKTTAALNRKYQRLIEQNDLELASEDRNAYQWRMTMYLLIISILAFVIYRFLLAVWPKPKKTLLEQLIDHLSTFFTP